MLSPDREVPKPPVESKWSDEPSSVNHLSSDNFSTFLADKQNVLTMFYAPWCGHCKKAKPHFTAAAERLKDDPNNHLAAVDCTEFKGETCFPIQENNSHVFCKRNIGFSQGSSSSLPHDMACHLNKLPTD